MTTPNSFSLERLRELHEAYAVVTAKSRAIDPPALRAAEEALADYLLEHVPAILALADRLQEADAVIAVFEASAESHNVEPMYGKLVAWRDAALTRHASRPRKRREG